MHVLVTTRRRLRKAAITAVLAAACSAALMSSAGVTLAGAAKAGVNKALTWGTKPTPPPKVRDYRVQRLPPPPPRKCNTHKHKDCSIIRDHRKK